MLLPLSRDCRLSLGLADHRRVLGRPSSCVSWRAGWQRSSLLLLNNGTRFVAVAYFRADHVGTNVTAAAFTDHNSDGKQRFPVVCVGLL